MSRVLDTGCWMLDARCSMLDTGCWMLVSGLWLLVTGHWFLVTGFWLLVSGYWFLVTGHWSLEKNGSGHKAHGKTQTRSKAQEGKSIYETQFSVLCPVVHFNFHLPHSEVPIQNSVLCFLSAFRIPNSKLCLLFFTTETAR